MKRKSTVRKCNTREHKESHKIWYENILKGKNFKTSF